MKLYMEVKDVKFEDLELAVNRALQEVDEGKYDKELREAGLVRPNDKALAGTATLSLPQGLSPEQWTTLAIDFAPLVATVAQGVWDVIVFPKLKKLFHPSHVREHRPKESKNKK